MAGKADTKAESQGQGNFFAVQRATWALVCKSCSMNEAVAYLVLARFAARRNHSSTQARMTTLHTKLGLSRGRVDGALKALENAGFVSQVSRSGTRRQRPQDVIQAEAVGMSDPRTFVKVT